MTDWLDRLPSIDVNTLPSVFSTQADAARTDARLQPGIRRHVARADRHSFINARKAKAAALALDRLPAPGETIHLAMDGEADLADFLKRVIDLAQEPVAELTIATLGFADKTIDILADLCDRGLVRHASLLASHYFRSVDTQLWSRAHAALTSRGCELFIARNHGKLELFAFESGRRLTLVSSANLRSCRNHETLVLFADPEVYGFWFGVLQELIQCAAAAGK